MQRLLIIGFAVLTAVTLAGLGSVQARADDRDRPEQQPAPVTLNLRQSLSGPSKEREPGFLYLSEPRFSAAADKGAQQMTPQATLTDSALTDDQDGGVALLFLPAGVTDPRHGLELFMSGRTRRPLLPQFSEGDPLSSGLDGGQAAQDIGLSFGYFGFNLGAAVRDHQLFLDGRVEGVDVGLGYRIGDFSTNVSVGEYRWEEGFSLSRFQDNFYKLELGASYRFWDSLRLSGGVQYLDFRRALFETEPDAQKLFLRGSIDF